MMVDKTKPVIINEIKENLANLAIPFPLQLIKTINIICICLIFSTSFWKVVYPMIGAERRINTKVK